jgi:hypothetical protein
MKNFIFFFLALFLAITVFAQVPQSFRYQAVARDNSGNILANQPVSFRISILSGSISGTITYRETHTSLTTNAFGLAELEIGKGTPVNGTFSSINWGSNSYFVQVEMDPAGGTSYQELSTSQLLSVPYALHAKTVETGDNWGTQSAATDASLTGSGLGASPLKIAQQSATSGQVLKWNGSTWMPANDNSSLWQNLDSRIYYNSGNVGIGTDNPQIQLHLNSAGVSSGLLLTNNASGNTLDDGLIFVSQYQADEPGNRYALILNQENSPLYIGTNDNWPGDITLLPGGNTGIGTTNPTARLHVNGQVRIGGGSPGSGKVLTSDATGLASWQTPITCNWQKIENNLFYNTGFVGIGTSVINYPLTIENNSNTCYIRLKDNQAAGGMRIGAYNGEMVFFNDNANKNIRFSINSGAGYFYLMTLDATNKRVGINTSTPDATLDVEGTMVVGSAGKVFSEIREITGTTGATGESTHVSYPSGYNMENTRVLSVEINFSGNAWVGLGANQQNNTITPRLFYYLGTSFLLYYPGTSQFQGRAYRIMVMKVQ